VRIAWKAGWLLASVAVTTVGACDGSCTENEFRHPVRVMNADTGCGIAATIDYRIECVDGCGEVIAEGTLDCAAPDSCEGSPLDCGIGWGPALGEARFELHASSPGYAPLATAHENSVDEHGCAERADPSSGFEVSLSSL
jgi:hypothetical protein